MPKKPHRRLILRPSSGKRMIELVRAGCSPMSLAKDFEPSARTMASWVKQADLDHAQR